VRKQNAETWYEVKHLDVERLLQDWRWLCKGPMTLLARNAFGDLFLRDDAGRVHRLEVGAGTLKEVAESELQFKALAGTKDKREEWFAEADTRQARDQGLEPNSSQCIGFRIPVVFAESALNNQPYVADLYETVSFLGEIHRQISSLPDGAKIELRIVP